jgi:hypothetical protein
VKEAKRLGKTPKSSITGKRLVAFGREKEPSTYSITATFPLGTVSKLAGALSLAVAHAAKGLTVRVLVIVTGTGFDGSFTTITGALSAAGRGPAAIAVLSPPCPHPASSGKALNKRQARSNGFLSDMRSLLE